MVRHQQHRPGMGPTMHLQFNAHDAQNPLRPLLHRTVLLRHRHAPKAQVQGP